MPAFSGGADDLTADPVGNDAHPPQPPRGHPRSPPRSGPGSGPAQRSDPRRALRPATPRRTAVPGFRVKTAPLACPAFQPLRRLAGASATRATSASPIAVLPILLVPRIEKKLVIMNELSYYVL